MIKTRFLPAAEAGFLHEIAYDSEVLEGYGVRFQHAVKAATARAVSNPGSGTPAPGGTRKMRVKGFPFCVVYRPSAAEILVVALAPDRRRPGYWLAPIE